MPKNRKTRAKELRQELIKLVGNGVFDKAQELVPEGGTGGLKKSGSISFDSKGFYIRYSAPYAKQVHDGDDGELPEYIQRPKDHDRNYSSTIKEGKYKGQTSRPVSYPNGRNFGNKRVVQWEGAPRGWYTTDSPREGNPWLDKAWESYTSSLSRREQTALTKLGIKLKNKFQDS
jgi:hypothetical protein